MKATEQVFFLIYEHLKLKLRIAVREALETVAASFLINRFQLFCRLDEAAVNNFLCRYAEARHQGEQQDKEFYDHPNKKAAMRDMRQGRDHHNGKKVSCYLCII